MGDPVTLESAPGVTAVLAAENQDAKSQPSNKNGKKADSSGSSFFTWFIVLALLGVWTSVAVVYFDLVDYQGVLDKAKGLQINLSEALQGKLVAYDTDGDGDFDVEDAKVLLGLKEKDVVVTSRSPEAAAPVETTHPEATPEAAVEPDPVPVEDVIEAAVAEDTAAPSPPEPEAASESAPVAPPEADEVIEEEPEVLEEEPAAEEEDAAVEEEEVMCVCY
ncbi:aspartyl/asparaginyl beta-hydroxylase isoform X1 [Neolamprologus brichardi]|uniref:aspartyl/asparaginyl beta-hydroxylase isoform X1 n=1 Tax=Neolamprologus brichardi TaxID=32507 RepID=UPI0003EBBDF5|nr:aspartyl/asparaginyl beta-hydroxylase isoform X1 [Neolamprologus brichardi]